MLSEPEAGGAFGHTGLMCAQLLDTVVMHLGLRLGNHRFAERVPLAGEGCVDICEDRVGQRPAAGRVGQLGVDGGAGRKIGREVGELAE